VQHPIWSTVDKLVRELGALRLSVMEAEVAGDDSHLSPARAALSHAATLIAQIGPETTELALADAWEAVRSARETIGHVGTLGASAQQAHASARALRAEAASQRERFDRSRVTVPPAVEERDAPLEGNGRLVVVAEDEAPLREDLRTCLEGVGFRVITARDGLEAIAVFQRNRGGVSAVITDLAMPRMDGAALIRTLRRLDRQLPIIALGDGGDGDENGVVTLPKPWDVDVLLAGLGALLSAR
jgi:CheY-like chemotaxis protein